jgi:hypothetical protein
MPDRLRDMKELFMVEAAKYGVFPLDNSFTAPRRDRARPPVGPYSSTRVSRLVFPTAAPPTLPASLTPSRPRSKFRKEVQKA